MHLIYEGNKYEFDIPNGLTIHYLKDLAQKIYHLDEKDINIMYNDQNLSNYNNNVLLSTIIPKGEKTITIHLERKDAIGKNLINSSNVSTSDTNVNDKQYKSMRNKFMKINASYNKISQKISNFNSLLENSINKIIKTIREFEEQIIKLNEKLQLFCYNKSFNRLNEVFDENQQSNNLSDKDLKSLNNEIESYIINYKFLITQHNFQDNILDFINQINDKFKFGKVKFGKIKNEDNYENIVLSLDQIFTELLFVNQKNNNSNNIESNNSHYLNISTNYNKKKKKRLLNDFPRIDSNSKDKSPNHFYTQSDKSYYSTSKTNNIKGNILKLLKKNNLNSSHKNLSLPTFRLNQSKSNLTSKNSPTKLNSRNFLPGLNNIKSYQTKTLDSIKNNILSKTQSKVPKNININKNNPIKNLLYNSQKDPINTSIKNNNINNLKNNNSKNNINDNNINNNNNNNNNENNNNNNKINKKEDDEFNEKEFNSRNRKNTVISNRFNQSMNIDTKPKIMDRDFKKKLSRNSNIKELTPNNKTVNTIEDKNENNSKFDIMSLKPMKKFQTKIPPLFDYSSSKEYNQDNKNYPKTDREKKDDISIPKIISAAIKKITQSKTNNNSNEISRIFDKKNTIESKSNKTKYKIVKNNNKNFKSSDKNKNESSDSDSEENTNNQKKNIRQDENNNLKETKTNFNSTKIDFSNKKKKKIISQLLKIQ